MSKSAERVRALVASGALSQDEGDKLIAAMGPSSPPSFATLLINPFERFGGEAAAAVGVVIAVLSAFVGLLRVRYDGFLDLHAVEATPSLTTCVVDQLAAFVLPSLLAWAVARVAGSRPRIVDLVGSVGLSRAPYLLAGLVAGLLPPGPKGAPHGPSLWIVVTVAIAAIAWSLTLHFQGFRNATGLAAKRGTVAFIVFVVASEIASAALVAALSGRSSP
jgi:hypothetical protein